MRQPLQDGLPAITARSIWACRTSYSALRAAHLLGYEVPPHWPLSLASETARPMTSGSRELRVEKTSAMEVCSRCATPSWSTHARRWARARYSSLRAERVTLGIWVARRAVQNERPNPLLGRLGYYNRRQRGPYFALMGRPRNPGYLPDAEPLLSALTSWTPGRVVSLTVSAAIIPGCLNGDEICAAT